MTTLLIRGADVLTLVNGTPQVALQQDIFIHGRTIEKVAPAGSLTAAGYPEVLDAQGLLAIPGLLNTHAHVPMVLFRGLVEDVSIESWFNDYIFPMESNLTPEDVYWGALLGLAESIQAGVTCVADHYFYMDQVAEAVRDAGMRANLVWAVFGHEGPEKLEATVDFVKRWQGEADGRITTWLGPHAPYTTGPEFLKLCARRAKELEVGIHIHVSETAEQVALSRHLYGITPVRMLYETGILDLPTILAHCLYPDDEDYHLLEGRPVGIAHAPKTYLKLGMGTAPVRRYRAHGIPVGLATDGAGSSNTLDILEQLRLMALTQKDLARDSTVFPVGEALEIAFEGGARVLHMEDALGAIMPGRLADIALLRQDDLLSFPRLNPAAGLVYSMGSTAVDTVVCNGKVLMESRRLLTIDTARVKAEVTQRLERLVRRVPGKRIATYPE